MFTIKATNAEGHQVFECASYRYRQSALQTSGEGSADSLDLYDQNGDVLQLLSITGTVYAMNSNGKTIDTFHAAPAQYPTSERLAVRGRG